jgi:hypothetical protein
MKTMLPVITPTTAAVPQYKDFSPTDKFVANKISFVKILQSAGSID